jgi:hypothetical protein
MRSFHLCQSATLLWGVTSHFPMKKLLRGTALSFIAFICIISFSTISTHAQGASPNGKKLNVALLDIKTNNLTDNQKIAIVERLRVLVDTHPSCSVIPRVQMLKTLGVQRYSGMFACRSLACVTPDASLIQSNFFIVGDVALSGKSDWKVSRIACFSGYPQPMVENIILIPWKQQLHFLKVF